MTAVLDLFVQRNQMLAAFFFVELILARTAGHLRLVTA